MRHNGQNNADYGVISSGNGNQWRRNRRFRGDSGWSAGYDQKHAEPGEVYIVLGLLRGFRLKAKIGRSRNHKRRLAYLKNDFGKFIFPVFVISTNSAIRLEQAAHHRFQTYREHEERGSGRTEWFRINPIRLLKMIWFLYVKEKQFACGDRLESFKTNFAVIVYNENVRLYRGGYHVLKSKLRSAKKNASFSAVS
jgi:hypothetical protein